MIYLFSKRLLDLLISLISIILLSPVFLIVIIILKFTAEGEIFYFQKRIGLKNKSFYIIKFATMLKDSINMGTGSITLKNDYRVTSFGKFLRKTKINELPQIINVIKGDISIVGPRPLVQKTFAMYSHKIQSKIYQIKPGITGIGSIVFRDEESIISSVKNEDPFIFYKRAISPHKGELEMWYQKNKSFCTDLKIIFVTAWIIIFPSSKIYNKLFINLPERDF